MKCRKCRRDIPEGCVFCPLCGAKLETAQRPKSRGNGQGSVYQLPNKSWRCVRTVGYHTADGKLRRQTRTKSGFKTKKEALAYLPQLADTPRPRTVTFAQLYEAWLPTHRAGKSTLDCYRAAYKWYKPVQDLALGDITVDDLQDCLDDCERGKRTRENMKALAGLMYKYGIPRRLTDLNLAEYLVVSGESGGKSGLPLEALEEIQKRVGKSRAADYVYCQCYLGFRPSEFLALDVRDYDRQERAFRGGAKTEAGTNRIVTVSPKIQPIIDRLTADKIGGPVFCAEGGGALRIEKYREMFYQLLADCGIDNPEYKVGDVTRKTYTPHSCRHTFATLMKRVGGADKDKLELIGHTSTEMLRHYQDVCYSDLRAITDAM